MATRRRTLSSMFGHAAIVGAGLTLAAFLLFGVGYGLWNMVRGHDRGAAGTFFITFGLNALISLSACGLFLFVVAVISDLQTNHSIAMWGITFQCAVASVGLVTGLVQRNARTVVR